MTPPSRRAVLRTCGVAAASGLAGCTAGFRAGSPDYVEEVEDGGPLPRARIAAENRREAVVRVTVELLTDGRTALERTRRVPPGGDLEFGPAVTDPGEHTVVARLASGEEARTTWTLEPGYEGTLTVVVREDGLAFDEDLAGGGCSTGELPYSVPSAEATFGDGRLTVTNEYDEQVRPTVAVAHDGARFFECTLELDPDESVTVEGLTDTAGTFTVTVDRPDGDQATDEWRVPAANNYPRLRVVLAGDGGTLVGCSTPGGKVPVTVRNPDDATRTVDLRLRRDDASVASRTVEVAAGATSSVDLPIPIGDFYTLVASTDTGTQRAMVVSCYCYAVQEPTVTLDGDVPRIDTPVLVCE